MRITMSTITDGNRWLAGVAQRLKEEFDRGAAPSAEQLTVRELLGKFGYERRWDGEGGINGRIQNELDALGLRCMPDFRNAWIHETVRVEIEPEDSDDSPVSGRPDPTPRVGILEMAHNWPMWVTPDQPLNAATTIMQLHGFSQMPVMTNERDLKGIVSWQSIGARYVLGRECQYVRDCMETAIEIPVDTPLFQAISIITEHGYVLVRNLKERNIISGIVTVSDLSYQWVKMAGPYLLTGEIEGHLRNLIHRKFTLEELSAEDVAGREIGGAADLNLGEFCRLLAQPHYWERLRLNIDRKEFVDHLEKVRVIRNSIMHFSPEVRRDDPEGTSDNNYYYRMLRDVARFFEELTKMGAM